MRTRRTRIGASCTTEAERLWLRSASLSDRGRHREAARLLLRSARLGSASACLNLGVAYHDGTGVPKSLDRAVRWYRRALKLGNIFALCNLGVLRREQGRISLAEHWFRKAVRAGDDDALLELAKLILDRDGPTATMRKLLKRLALSGASTEASREEGAAILAALSQPRRRKTSVVEFPDLGPETRRVRAQINRDRAQINRRILSIEAKALGLLARSDWKPSTKTKTVPRWEPPPMPDWFSAPWPAARNRTRKKRKN